jgi:iron complex transport system ATP-binding protein
MNYLLETKQLSIEINNKRICHQLDLQIQPGEIWGILGANGCGKTTFLQALARLHPIVSGKILLHDENIYAMAEKAIAKKLGILFQETNYAFSQSVLETCLMGRYPHIASFSWESAEDKSIAIAALTLMQLENKIDKNCQSLSGGEQRRLALATLLTQAPTLFLLDEPLNHLDIHHQIKIMHHLKMLVEKCSSAALLTLHDVNITQHFCNRVLILFDDGTILHGKTDEVLCETNLTRAYHHPIQAYRFSDGLYWRPKFNEM